MSKGASIFDVGNSFQMQDKSCSYCTPTASTMILTLFVYVPEYIHPTELRGMQEKTGSNKLSLNPLMFVTSKFERQKQNHFSFLGVYCIELQLSMNFVFVTPCAKEGGGRFYILKVKEHEIKRDFNSFYNLELVFAGKCINHVSNPRG